MKKTLGLLFALVVIASPAFAQKVTIDYAHEFDFEQIKTFQYVANKDAASGNQLVDDRIRNAIVRELTEGGLREVESDPDLFVTYHVSTRDNTVYSTTTMGYGGYRGGWGGWGGVGMGSASTTATTFTEGTLIIDAYDPEEKKMVFRGSGTVTLKAKPEKVSKQIDNILSKMGAKWDKILRNQGK